MEKRHLYSVLRLLSRFPEFGVALRRFLHKLIGREALASARVLSKREKDMTRAVVESFNTGEKYTEMLSLCPTLVTVLHGACSLERLVNIEVRCTFLISRISTLPRFNHLLH